MRAHPPGTKTNDTAKPKQNPASSATQLPLFLFEFKTNVLVEKFKYRKPFVVSYSIMALTMIALLIFGINIATLAILTVASLCLVFLEPAREMYLYEKLNKSDEEKVQPVYMSADIIAGTILRIVIGIVLIALSSAASYVIMAISMLVIAWYCRNVED